MVVFWWILLYTSTVSLFGTIINKIDIRNPIDSEYKNKKSISAFFAIITFALLLFFVGCRSEFNDTYYYKDLFENYITGNLSQIKEIYLSDSRSKYFNILQCLFKHYISKNYTIWFFALAIFQLGAIIRIFYKYTCDYFMSSYLYIASGSFAWLMGGIRQYFAVCIVLYGFDLLIQRKTFRFILLVLFASLFHTAVIIWILIYFICISKPWSWKIWAFAGATVVIILSLDSFTSVLDVVLEDTNYSDITSHFVEGNGMNYIRLIVNCVPWLLALLCKNQIEEENNLFLDISVNLSFISSLIYLIAIFTSGIIVGRLPACFDVVNFILLPWLVKKYYSRITGFVLTFSCYVFYFLYFYYDMVVKGTGQYGSDLLGIVYGK